MSLTVSFIRRREPAISSRSTPPWARSASPICRAIPARGGQQGARAPGPPLGDALQNVLAGLLADAGDPDDLLRAAQGFQPLDRVHAALLVERPRRARAEAADLQEREEGRRQLLPQLLELGDAAGVQVLLDLGGEVLADRRQRGQPAAGGDGAHVLGQGLQRLGRALVSADAEDGLVARLQQVRHLVEQARHVKVHWLMVHSASS
jgi:hypothetical protein